MCLASDQSILCQLTVVGHLTAVCEMDGGRWWTGDHCAQEFVGETWTARMEQLWVWGGHEM